MTLVRTISTLALIAALLALAGPVRAQTPGQPPFEACKPGGFTVIDYPDEFGPRAEAEFDVLIDERFQGEFLTGQRIWLPVIEGAIEKWNNLPGATWRFNNRGLTSEEFSLIDERLTISACGGLFACPDGSPPAPPGGPGGGVVDFFPQTTLAVTLITEDNTAGKGIRNSDVFFNPTIPFEVNPDDGQIDFETVLIHELGHALGLGHNDNCVADPTVMESVVDLNERKRELADPEREGVRFLYPADSEPSIRVYDAERSVRFESRADGLPPFGQAVNVFGIRNHRWLAEPADSWVIPVPAVGRFGVDNDVEIRVDPSGLAPGTYTSTVALRDENHPGPAVTLSVTLEIGAGLPAEDDLPRMSSGGIVNGANQLSARLAPGSLITLYGQNLASATGEAQGFPLPRRLEGTEVIIDGHEAPLLFVSANQINAIVPNEALPGRSGIILRNGFGQDRGTPFDILPAAPEMFLLDDRHVIALNQDGTLNGAGAPAAPGSIVTIFFTGLGWTHPFIETGTRAPGGPLAVPQLASRALVAGTEAEINFIGLTPGFAGLSQLNVQIPQGFSGELPIQIEIGGRRSNLGFLTTE